MILTEVENGTPFSLDIDHHYFPPHLVVSDKVYGLRETCNCHKVFVKVDSKTQIISLL